MGVMEGGDKYIVVGDINLENQVVERDVEG